MKISGNSTASFSLTQPLKRWMHHHPVEQKTTLVALGAFGLNILYQGIVERSFYKASLGAAAAGSFYLIDKFLPLFVPPAHEPNDKIFSEGFCRGVSLSYQGNLPILTIPGDVCAFDAGYGKGYLMAEQIKDLIEKNRFMFFTLKGFPTKIPSLVEKIKTVIPKEYIDELEGISEGFNAKRKQWVFKVDELLLEDLIYFHLIPDHGNLDFKELNRWAQTSDDVMGCTVIIDGDAQSGPLAVRTVDWFPLDVYGKYAHVELRETKKGLRVAGQSFPFFAGCLTAMNEYGVVAAMNVARGITDYPDKMPAVFFLRYLVENCISADQVSMFLQNNSPLGSFNLSVMDQEKAFSFHFYQGRKGKHYRREWVQGTPLVTLNFRYGEKGETNATPTNSFQGKIEIEQSYKENKLNHPSERVLSALKGLEVNNIRTITAAYIDPKQKIFKIAFDNGYAADCPLMEIPAKAWFERL